MNSILKSWLLFFCILIAVLSSAQNFQEVYFPSYLLLKMKYASTAVADVDGDGDQDVLISGYNTVSLQIITKLYINKGFNNFTLSSSSFTNVIDAKMEFADIDGDGDKDVMVVGSTGFGLSPSTKLYKNYGNGVFGVAGGAFVNVTAGSIAFADVDGDNDQDVLITGATSPSYLPTSKLYTNNGNGVFSLVAGTPFDEVAYSSIKFADIDGDNDQDVLITGSNGSNLPISKLYSNDGNGAFTEVLGTPFVAVKNSSVAFEDIDGDNDQDVLITGYNSSTQPISNLYSNDGNGFFTEVLGIPFTAVVAGAIAFADIDGDTDKDVLITGRTGSSQPISKLYVNDGNGVFTDDIGLPLIGINYSTINFTDIEGDGDQDVLFTGATSTNANDGILRLYINDGGKFYVPSPFDGVDHGELSFADIDGDNDQDLLVTGDNGAINGSLGISNSRIAKLYLNLGSNFFTHIANLDSVRYSSIAFADIDGDGDQDVLIIGDRANGLTVSNLLINDGSGNYSSGVSPSNSALTNGDVAFADVDGDGDQDFLVTGLDMTKLYLNDGGGNFTLASGTSFLGLSKSAISFADVDGDGDQDVLITGFRQANFSNNAKLYTNNGSGVFSEVFGTPFISVSYSSSAFADVDGDGDQDVLITGTNSTSQLTILYTNDGNGVFTEVLGTSFDNSYQGAVAFADVDNDGDQDVIITGFTGGTEQTKLYGNDGNGVFTEVLGTPFVGTFNSSIDFADVDVDGDQDFIITGDYVNSTGYYRIKLYMNTPCSATLNFVSTVSACSSYTWMDSVTYTSNNNTATYLGTNAVGCPTITTLNLSLIILDTTVSLLGNLISSNQTAAQYQWLDCDSSYQPIAGEINQTFSPTSNGNYAVSISKYWCVDTSSCISITSVGTNDVTNDFGIEIFPNPNTGLFTIEKPHGLNKHVEVKLLDITSKLILEKEIPSGQQKIDIEINNLSKGMYYLQLIVDDKVFVKKILKN